MRTLTIGGRTIPIQAVVVVAAIIVLIVTGLRAGLFDDTPAIRRPAVPTAAPTAPGAPAATSQPGAGLTGGEPADWSGAALDIMLKLVAVLALAYLALAALRRYTGGAALGKRGGTVKVLETATLAPNRLLYLVRAGDRKLLLGVTPTQITALTTWWEVEDTEHISLGHLDFGPEAEPPAVPTRRQP